jgi:hypothetical protein
VAQRNDQVFQLSLTEIAFTIAFILLILLGYLVFKEESGRLEAEAALAKTQNAELTTAALNSAKNNLAAALQAAGTSSPDEVITKLVAADEVRAERDRLKQQIEGLDAKLTALTELQNQLEKAGKTNHPEVTREEIESALVFQDELRKALNPQPGTEAAPAQQATSVEATGKKTSKEQHNKETLQLVKQAIATSGELRAQIKRQLNRELVRDQESQVIQEIVSAAKSFEDLGKGGTNPEKIRKENADLRGQVAFLKNRLDARGGRDFPPCWADENGKVEFLFSVEMKPDSVVVNPAWPQKREAVARSLPGITDVLAGPLSIQSFVNGIQGIFKWSKSQDPECRHYVQLKSSIPDAVQSDRARLLVESYFYKVESRR